MARVDLRGVAERLAAAEDVSAIGNIVGDACEGGLPFGSLAYAVFEPSVTVRPCIVVRSTEFAPEWIARRFPEMMLAIERDLGGLQAALSERHAYDGYEKFPAETIKNTELLNDHWRVYRADQQLVAPMWHAGVPVGYFTISRSAKEARFTADDLRFFEELRRLAERALDGLTAFFQEGQLSRTLDALSQVFPYPAYLFESSGKLRWMSDEAAVRLGVAAAKLGSARLIRASHALEELSACGRGFVQNPAHDGEGRLRTVGVLRPRERLATRRFGENGESLVLLSIIPAMATLPGESMGLSTASLPRLGAVESKVARLAAEGYTVLNIATRLGVTEATVRTHLHRVYVKLGVHGRAELTCALLRGRE
jgi:DNA-binding CsgD family transcriptional regulator/GAF domain-containing protein